MSHENHLHLHDNHHDSPQVEDDLFLDRVVAVGRGSRRLPNPGLVLLAGHHIDNQGGQCSGHCGQCQGLVLMMMAVLMMDWGLVVNVQVSCQTSQKERKRKRCRGWFPRKWRSHRGLSDAKILPHLLFDENDNDDLDESGNYNKYIMILMSHSQSHPPLSLF